tara:strand:- start:59 stop:238 length:180 start_codon:yes stop_codon:yes gene_type:complete
MKQASEFMKLAADVRIKPIGPEKRSVTPNSTCGTAGKTDLAKICILRIDFSRICFSVLK